MEDPYEVGSRRLAEASRTGGKRGQIVLTTSDALKHAFNKWSHLACVPIGLNDHRLGSEDCGTLFWDVERYWTYAQAVSGRPKFFTTAAGFFGLAPFNVTVNSLIVLLHGSKLACTLGGESWWFIRVCRLRVCPWYHV